MIKVILLLIWPVIFFAQYEDYLQLIRQYKTLGPNGNYLNKEIEIVIDPREMSQIEKNSRRLVGIVAQDKYWIWLNDAVRFPNGNSGVYGRLIWRASLTGYPGIAVMIVSTDGRVVLNCNYRHATRSWELELPRGLRNANESIEEAALREVREETGMTIDKLFLLGKMLPDSGTMNSIVPLFMATLVYKGKREPEESESIIANPVFTIDEIKKGFVQGYLPVKIDGRIQNVSLKDPFLAFAILQAELQHKL